MCVKNWWGEIWLKRNPVVIEKASVARWKSTREKNEGVREAEKERENEISVSLSEILNQFQKNMTCLKLLLFSLMASSDE